MIGFTYLKMLSFIRMGIFFLNATIAMTHHWRKALKPFQQERLFLLVLIAGNYALQSYRIITISGKYTAKVPKIINT